MRKGKILWTQNPPGDLITYMEAADAEEEAMFVAERILYHQKSDPSARIAVLYRTNFLSRVLEEKLRRYNMKYRIVGGFSFYERAEIKDMISYLTVALNPHDSVNLLRIINSPARGIGKTTTDALEELAVERGTSHVGRHRNRRARSSGCRCGRLARLEAFYQMVAEFVQAAGELSNAALLEKIVTATKYVEMLQEEGTEEAESRIENIRELLTAAEESQERGEKLRDFLDHAALVSDQDAYDEAVADFADDAAHGQRAGVSGRVHHGTGRRPVSAQPFDHGDAPQLEEERRLFYVGMTRAEDKLYLTSARFRRYFGNMDQQVSEPSRFLAEIPQELVDEAGERRRKPAMKYEGSSYDTVDAVMKVLGGGENKAVSGLQTVRAQEERRPAPGLWVPASSTRNTATARSCAPKVRATISN